MAKRLQLAARPRDGLPYEAAYPRAAVRLRLQHQPLHRLPELHHGLQVDLDLLQGPGAHVVGNVETKPYGGYPQFWDVEDPGAARAGATRAARRWDRRAEGRRAGALRRVRRADDLRGGGERSRPDSARVLGYLPDRRGVELAQHLRGQPGRRARQAASSATGRRGAAGAQDLVLLPRAHLQPLHLSGLPRRLPAQGDLQAARGRHRAHRPERVPRLPQVRRGVPVQEVDVPRQHARLREVHRLLPARRGQGPGERAASRWRRAAWRRASARSACRAW